MHTILIKKEKGKINARENVMRKIDNILDENLQNGEYTLTFRKAGNKRLLSQNAIMWMWFSCLSDATGLTKEDIHDYYCSKFLLRHIKIQDEEVTVHGGTSRLDRDTMSIFLENVREDAFADFGIVLPDSGEVPLDSEIEQDYE